MQYPQRYVFSLNLPGTPCMSWGEHWRPPLTSARGSSSGSPRPIGSSGSESVVVSETRVSLLLSDPGNTAAPAHEVHTHSTVRHAALPHAQRHQCNAQKLEFFNKPKPIFLFCTHGRRFMQGSCTGDDLGRPGNNLKAMCFNSALNWLHRFPAAWTQVYSPRSINTCV